MIALLLLLLSQPKLMHSRSCSLKGSHVFSLYARTGVIATAAPTLVVLVVQKNR